MTELKFGIQGRIQDLKLGVGGTNGLEKAGRGELWIYFKYTIIIIFIFQL